MDGAPSRRESRRASRHARRPSSHGSIRVSTFGVAGGWVGDGSGEPNRSSCAGQRGCGGPYALGGSDPATVGVIADPPACGHRLRLLLRGNQTEAPTRGVPGWARESIVRIRRRGDVTKRTYRTLAAPPRTSSLLFPNDQRLILRARSLTRVEPPSLSQRRGHRTSPPCAIILLPCTICRRGNAFPTCGSPRARTRWRSR